MRSAKQQIATLRLIMMNNCHLGADDSESKNFLSEVIIRGLNKEPFPEPDWELFSEPESKSVEERLTKRAKDIHKKIIDDGITEISLSDGLYYGKHSKFAKDNLK